MGQKVHPNGFRVGITRDWISRWYARKKEFGDLLLEDYQVRKMIKGEYAFAGIPKIEIERKVTRPELNAQLVSEAVAEQLQKRAAYRRAIKRQVQFTMEKGAKGVKIRIAGRLGGREMSSQVTQAKGSIPLHTLKADIDYGFSEAKTKAGRIGVKCWIYTGDIAKPAEGN